MDFIMAALQLTPVIVSAGEDIEQFVSWAIAVYASPDGPTDDDWNTLNSKEATLRTQLNGPG
jgi:hypothetical protein